MKNVRIAFQRVIEFFLEWIQVLKRTERLELESLENQEERQYLLRVVSRVCYLIEQLRLINPIFLVEEAYLTCFMALIWVNRNRGRKQDLVIATCMFLASKFLEDDPIYLEELETTTGIKPDEILGFEVSLLEEVGYDLLIPYQLSSSEDFRALIRTTGNEERIESYLFRE